MKKEKAATCSNKYVRTNEKKQPTKTFEEYHAYMKLLAEQYKIEGADSYVEPEIKYLRDLPEEPSKRPIRIKQFSDKDIAHIEALALFLTLEQIAGYFHLTQIEFNVSMDRDPRVLEAYNKGLSSGVKIVSNSLLSSAITEGNVAAQMFYLKTRGRWKDAKDETDLAMNNLLMYLEELPDDKCTPKELANLLRCRFRATGISL